ncbi:MAG: DUF1549 domain-containing protein [Gemmataceae bacterium]
MQYYHDTFGRLLALLPWLIIPTLCSASENAAKNLLPADQPIASVIDHHIDAQLKASQVAPAPQASDAAFLRRVTLDLVGRIPTRSELAAYLKSNDKNKKETLVDRLLASPGFVRHQAQRLLVLLEGDGPESRRGNRNGLRDYLRDGLAQDRSWDTMFKELIVPNQADKQQARASEFLKSRIRDLDKTTVDVSTVFFGVNISCAQCHEHPHVLEWTQDHFYGMKSFFARTFDNGGFLAERSTGAVNFTPNGGKPKVAEVMFLTGEKIDPPGMKGDKNQEKKERSLFSKLKKQRKPAPLPEFSLRQKFLEVALGPKGRRLFSRSIVNRLWFQYCGLGLVMPLYQMHEENPASHPELLEWLARDTHDHGYDLKRLIRGIVLSQAYSRSSQWTEKEVPAEKLFARALVRPLTPMQLSRSLLLASTDPFTLPNDAKQLPDHFASLDRRAEGLASFFPEPGHGFQVSVKEAMLFSNNERIARDLLQGGNSLVESLTKIKDLRDRAELAVKTIFTREPRSTEIDLLSSYMREQDGRTQEICQQVVWALLTSPEFRFNH